MALTIQCRRRFAQTSINLHGAVMRLDCQHRRVQDSDDVARVSCLTSVWLSRRRKIYGSSLFSEADLRFNKGPSSVLLLQSYRRREDFYAEHRSNFHLATFAAR